VLHTVRAGDNLGSVALIYGLQPRDLIAANLHRRWSFLDTLQPGEVLHVPSASGEIGAGGGIPDFATLITSVPQAGSSWNGVNAQLTAEGNGPGTAVNAVAQQNFYMTWTQLQQQTGAATSADLTTVSNAAGSLLMNTSTIAGAVSNVEGLIAGATSGNTTAIVQSFTGAIVSGIGLEVAAGSISLGVGAAIVFGLEIAAAAFSQLFGQSAPAATVCNSQLSYVPTIVVGCTWTAGAEIKGGPGTGGHPNPYWRRFPEPSRTGDSWWFQAHAPLFDTWTSGSSSDQWGYDNSAAEQASAPRPIDAAFRVYHQLECDVRAVAMVAVLPDGGGPYVSITNGLPGFATARPSDVAFARFIMAYFAAWKANQEYAFNGLRPPSDDGTVLAQVAKFWNDAHESAGAGDYTIAPRNTNQDAYQTDPVTPTATCEGNLTDEYYYVQMLLPYVTAQLPNPPTDSNGNLTIHTGARKSGAIAAGAHGAAAPAGSSSSAGTVVLVGGGLLAAAAAAWALTGHSFSWEAIKAVFKHASGSHDSKR